MSTSHPTTLSGYVLTLDAVRRAITTLQPITIHETFPVYLHLRRQASVLGRFEDLEPDWQGEPHRWMAIPGGPPRKPHFRPFTSRGSSLNAFWMNDNLAGSYAPSSLRDKRRLYVGANDEYHLPAHPDGTPDPQPILGGVLLGKPVPAWAVAAFIFRNRLFIPGDVLAITEPGWNDLLAVFEDYFSWTDSERTTLFDWSHPASPCFEEFVADA